MKKLSELSNDTLLTVKQRLGGDFSVMSKKGFLDSYYFLDYQTEPFPNITIAEPFYAKFDLYNWLVYVGEDHCYEGWVEDVCERLAIEPETKAFIDRVDQIFRAYPTYYEGEPVEVDIMPNDSIEMKYEKIGEILNESCNKTFDDYDWVPYCKNCDKKLDGLSKPNYCSNCGAKLYWDREIKEREE